MNFSARHYLWFVNVLVLGLIVWSAVGLGLSVLGRSLEFGLDERRPIHTPHAGVPGLKALSNYEAIIRHNIFGGRAEPEAPPESKPKPETVSASLGDIRLKGTIVDQNSGWALAILEDASTREQNLYRAGDRIQDTEIIRVERDAVILKKGGREIRLQLQQAEGDSAPQPRNNQAARSPGPSSGGGDEEAIAQAVGPNSFVVSRETLSRHMDDLNFFMSNVRIQPFFKDGQPYGFMVAAVRPGTPIHQLGFRRSDVILAVNDVEVGNPEDLINLYRQVQQLENVTVTIERGGQPLTLNYSIR